MAFSWATSASAEGPITPFVGTPGDWECRSVSLDPGNAIGMWSVPIDQQTVSARVLFRSGASQRSLRLRMMKEDARVLEVEVAALLRKARPRPIRFEARSGKGGRCEIVQVTG